jgi:hypothetical protein
VMWNHDGSGLLVAPLPPYTPTPDPRERTTVWFFGLDGSATRSVTVPRSVMVQLSPDGTRLLLYTVSDIVWADPADHRRGRMFGRAHNQIYDLSSGRLSPTPARVGDWYDDQHLYQWNEEGDRSELVILDLATGKVTAKFPLEDDPTVSYVGPSLVRLTGPAPKGAIVV